MNLIPRLHNPGEEQVYLRHHLLTDHENSASYDGIVRQIAFKFFAPIPTKATDLIPVNNSLINKNRNSDKYMTTSPSNSELNVNDGANDLNQLITSEPIDAVIGNHSMSSTEVIALNDKINLNNKSDLNGVSIGANYSTALLVTIAIGCSLLILNMLIFAGVYYQLDKNSTLRQKNVKNSRLSSSDHHSHYHYNDVNIDPL